MVVTQQKNVSLQGPILVVEDDRDVRVTIQWALEDEGLPVETAADGRQALHEANLRKPELVVLDMSLPLLDGFGVAAGLHESYGDEIPILVITADGRAADKARRIGAVTFLNKPFDIEELLYTVRDILTAR